MVIITQLTYSITQEGNPFSTEAPKVDTALTQIQTVVNSQLTADNMPTVLTAATSQPSRVLGTAYQPNASRPTLVIVNVNGSVTANIGATSSPTTAVNVSYSSGNQQAMTFVVPAGWYYKLVNTAFGVLNTVTEQTL